MAITSAIQHNRVLRAARMLFVLMCCAICLPAISQQADTAVTLEKVVITDRKKPAEFKSSLPVQSLDHNLLRNTNITSVGEAIRFFSGAVVKDYGGIGGLKTISVRSLGAANSAIFYDGIPVSDMQTGQIDLSRFPATFISRISLYQGQPDDLLWPAKAYASASVLGVETNTFQPVNFSEVRWQGGITAGSFGMWQPTAALYTPVGKNMVLSTQVQYLVSNGDYPYVIHNGNYTEKTTRSNAAIETHQAEVNLAKLFHDSSLLQGKLSYYSSDRQLPGATVFFNPRSAQRLWNNDLLFQGRYIKKFEKKTTVLFSGKYAKSYLRYVDPDFLNGRGGLDSRYTQHEAYASAVARQLLTEDLEMALASDISFSKLAANTNNFVYPSRLGLWNNISLQYSAGNVKLNTSLVSIFIRDRFRTGKESADYDQLAPAISMSYKPDSLSPWLFRLFYKGAFRIPTFNDLYYNFIGNRDLRPEFSSQYNAGITYSRPFQPTVQKFNVSVDGYVNQIRDKIIAVPGQNLFNWSMLNVGKAKISGMDLNVETNIRFAEQISLFNRIATTWQEAIDMSDPSSASYKNRIPYTPDLSGSWLLIFKYHQWTAGYSLLYSGKRYALGTNDKTNLLSAWSTHDFSISRSIRFDKIELTVKAEASNISNQQYEVVRYFPMPGRNYKITITINNH